MSAAKDEVAARLQQLYDKHGELTPSIVVEDARSEASPLHTEFEWDDKKAAAKHRLHQARVLIRSVSYLYRTETRTLELPTYTRDPDADHHEQGYRPVAEVATQKEQARRVLMRELQRVSRATERMETLAAAFKMEDELQALRQRIDGMIGVVSEEERAGIQ